jgi:hypothetical protein
VLPTRLDSAIAPAPLRESPGIAAFLGWLVPGLGHLWLGRPGKALHYFLVIGAAYALGLHLSEGLSVSYERHAIWLAAQAWAALPTAAVAWLTQDAEVVRRIPHYEVGQLYVAVASLLNLVAMADAVGIADALAKARGTFRVVPLDPGVLVLERVPAAALGHPATAAQDEWPPPEAIAPTPGAPPPEAP